MIVRPSCSQSEAALWRLHALACVAAPYVLVRAAVAVLVSIGYSFPMHARFVFGAVR